MSVHRSVDYKRYCISVLSAHEQIDALHIVADKSWHDLIGKVLEKADRSLIA